MALRDRAIQSSKYLCDHWERRNFKSEASPKIPERGTTFLQRFTSFEWWKDLNLPKDEYGGEERKRGGAGSRKKRRVTGSPRPPTIYKQGFYNPEYPTTGPEYPDRPEYPGPGPETPAPPEAELICQKGDLIFMNFGLDTIDFDEKNLMVWDKIT